MLEKLLRGKALPFPDTPENSEKIKKLLTYRRDLNLWVLPKEYWESCFYSISDSLWEFMSTDLYKIRKFTKAASDPGFGIAPGEYITYGKFRVGRRFFMNKNCLMIHHKCTDVTDF